MDILSPIIWLFSIIGFSAASGLHYEPSHNGATRAGGSVYVIADNSPYLYHYNIRQETLGKILLDSMQKEGLVAKSEKDDLEAMCDLGETIVMVGSGSTPTRTKGFIFHKKTQLVEKLNLGTLYTQLRQAGQLNEQNFNIEAVAYKEHTWYFLNRGNGDKNRNVVFTFKADSSLNLPQKEQLFIKAHHIKLPPLDNCPSGFSDAVIKDDRLYFLATAEDKASNYEDGINKGTFISYLDIHSWNIGLVRRLSRTKKLEGLTLYTQGNIEGNEKTTSFLLCEDPDDATKTICPIYQYNYNPKIQ
ncbi:hypothetical protein GCM10027566_23490 [Arachidicoccus ginsenosidivorans]